MKALERAITRTLALRKLPPLTTRRLIREQAGVSQQALAETVGVSRESISRWEIGNRQPKHGDHAERYLKALEYLANSDALA